ncbi:hypothetical protein VTO42DRAFT_2911 [Malbranchea cinnamomea]
MASSPPGSPAPQRPMSAMIRPPRSNSRMSISSKQGGGSRASDEDGKTAVKVAVRVRPPLRPQDPGYELIPQRFQRPIAHVTSPTSLAIDTPQGRKLFVFDRVFSEQVDQEGIWEYLHDSVNSFVQGYNVSILAYGQSGAGKSYTMGTASEQSDPKAMGIIPRAAQALFEILNNSGQTHNRTASSASGPVSGLRTPTRYSISSTSQFGRAGSDKNWQLKATYVEIYNEQLRDLLLPESTPMQDRPTVTIREDPKGRIILTGLRQVNISSYEDLMGALSFGSAIRQTDATAINAKSSRSHAVFSLNLVQHKDGSSSTLTREKRFSMPVEALGGSDAAAVTIDSKLHFVDLAGSERLKNTGASGERAKEGISINAGLASLGKVISQLSSRQAGAHVSYRDSKLTRLLQDSLGGNAITYMIACVTPAEFHLSETLNTVQYAQRARAIQSKPRIQQTMDESDKQAVIDRLKAEIAFLRQQLRNSESGGERRNNAPQERGDRPSEREIELQNHLLDIQESYNSLSQRHAKLISELTKANDFNGDSEDLNNIIGDSAIERLKRSHSFAESVERVVLEYEKTIQSLESSLSNTRSSLANTESMLLERETKCAYIETVNSQLQARIQKMLDREANTENYLHELEAKLDGHSTGEEKNVAIIAELRKEIARARENEASCEDYISTLEERLAEADQDMELMQREIDRLEHVIDRQRSLGKLDNLLYELDHIQQNGTKHEYERDRVSTPSGRESRQRRPRNHSLDVLVEAAETAIPESDDDLVEPNHSAENSPEEVEVDVAESDQSGLEALEKVAIPRKVPEPVKPDDEEKPEEDMRPTTSHSRVSTEKLESVTRELLELRAQHEATVNDYDLLSAKYEEALRTLAELQDAVDEARHAPTRSVDTPATASRPVSFLGDPRLQELKSGGQQQSSRSLSSELSLAEDSPTSPATIESPRKSSSGQPKPEDKEQEDARARELESLRNLLYEHQLGMGAVTQKYAQLQAEHEQTLSMVETLKGELERAKAAIPASSTPAQKVIRRMTSQNMTSVDRAHRSLAALRNIAAEEFETRPDIMQNFELHLNNAMHELHFRMERIQALEADNQNIKKEMEVKSTIISGLTRERSSLQGASPVDMNVVSQLRDQIVAYENQMKEMQESHDAKEAELRNELSSLNDVLREYKAAVEEHEAEIKTLREVLESTQGEKEQLEAEYNVTAAALQSTQEKLQATLAELDAASAERAEWQEKHTALLAELEAASAERAEWQSKHKAATESLQSSEKQLQSTLAELDATLASLDALRNERKDVAGASAGEIAVATAKLESERAELQELVDSLKKEIENQNATIATHLASISDLEKQLAEAKDRLAENNAKDASVEEIESYKSRITELIAELDSHKSTVETQKSELSSLQTSRDEALKELEAKMKATAESQVEARIAEENARHEQVVNDLRNEITNSKAELTQLLDTISGLLKTPVTIGTIQDQLQDMLAQKQHYADKYGELIDTNEELLRQLDSKQASHDKLEKQLGELNEREKQHEAQINELARLVATHEEALKAKEELVAKKDAIIKDITAEKEKSVRLVEELEEQITNTFDQHQNRMSVIQQERAQALEEAKNKISQYEKEIEAYRARIDQLEGNARAASPEGHSVDRTSSITSGLRKSGSATSLPSPPPAIPLPPLPNIAAATNGASQISPPGSRHQSKDMAHVNAQLVEDQEARIRTIEKHLHAEKQLTATLEEALGDLEAQSNKVKADMEAWKKKALMLEEEVNTLKAERKSARLSVQQMEEERNARREAEAARAHLEEKMNAINKKKKKSTLNCF